MVVDTSALVAILRDEPEREAFVDILTSAEDPLISAATLLECSIVQTGVEEGIADLDDLLRASGVRCVAFDAAQALAAREAWQRYGKGRSPAKLNLGDCFSYALAKTQDRPLLFKGNDFGETDVRVAT
jgi:ribonuclease VapC